MIDNHADPHDPARWDIAAYALGILHPADIDHCEQHLAECSSCAAELEQLLPASSLLADVDPADLRAVDDPVRWERLASTVVRDRRRARQRQRRVVAIGAAVAATVAGLALFAGATWLGGEAAPPTLADPDRSPSTAGSSAGPPAPGIGGPELGEGEQLSHTDPVTGVHADVLLASLDWGTQVSFALSSLAGPHECQLLLVHADGTAEVAASWLVPAAGYGTAQQPAPLILQAATATARGELTELRVAALEPDGTISLLVTVSL